MATVSAKGDQRQAIELSKSNRIVAAKKKSGLGKSLAPPKRAQLLGDCIF
jgi:hypothetical protein